MKEAVVSVAFTAVPWAGHRYALGAWDMFKACAHRELILMKRHSFTYKTRCARRICILGAMAISLACEGIRFGMVKAGDQVREMLQAAWNKCVTKHVALIEGLL